jgi:hypothetical protein
VLLASGALVVSEAAMPSSHDVGGRRRGALPIRSNKQSRVGCIDLSGHASAVGRGRVFRNRVDESTAFYK